MAGEEGRLAWRCRRGMKELDLVLMRYLRERWSAASDAEKASFERILDLPDPMLAAYLTGRERSPDFEVQGLLDQMRWRGRVIPIQRTLPPQDCNGEP